MKPSEYILGPSDPVALDRARDETLQLENLVAYLDAEHERRSKFEQDITERVWALEASMPGGTGSISEVQCECGFVAKVAHLRLDTPVIRERMKRDALAAHDCPKREDPCIICGRPTFDIIDRYQTADRRPLCSKACFDRVLAAPVGVYAGDGHPALRTEKP